MLHIVAADDEAELRDYYQRILPHFGHQVLATPANGTELACVCATIRSDLMIIDLEMPDETSEVWPICSSKIAPVILVTNRDHDEVRWMTTDDRTRVLVKPFSMPELLWTIGEVTRPRALARPRHPT